MTESNPQPDSKKSIIQDRLYDIYDLEATLRRLLSLQRGRSFRLKARKLFPNFKYRRQVTMQMRLQYKSLLNELMKMHRSRTPITDDKGRLWRVKEVSNNEALLEMVLSIPSSST
jgi:hypothetical protein